MKVLFINYSDYANLSFNLSESLKSVGVDSQCLCLTSHPFGYEKQGIHVSHITMIEQLQTADLVIIGHSSPFLIEYIPKGKNVWVLHTGTAYRQNHLGHNEIFNPIVTGTLTDSPEFMELGAKNIHYVATAIDTDAIQQIRCGCDELIFAHYPNKGGTKGTEKIKEMMAGFDVKFVVDDTNVPHKENLNRMAQCDVYIELFAPQQDGKTYGSFGVTAFESCAMGKITITNSLFNDVYTTAYGVGELCVANSEETFKVWIKNWMDASRLEIMKKQDDVRNWIVEKHSYKATGNYLKKVLGL